MFEKDHRLILKNLSLRVTSSKLEEIFGKYGSVKNVDLKEKNDIDNKKNKFAFVTISTNHRQLNECINEVNRLKIDGQKLNVDLAKESFLERLKRERAEAADRDYKDNKDIINAAIPDKITSVKPLDPILDDFHIKGKNKKRKFDDHDLEDIAKNVEVIEPKVYKERHNQTKNFDKQVEESSQVVDKPEIKVEKIVHESERKRLMAVKQRKQAMKHREWVVKNALKMMDSGLLNKKKLFNDDSENSEEETSKMNKKQALFESEQEDDEDFGWDEKKLAAKDKLGSKLVKLQSNFNSDQRFVLDERFIENENEEEQSQNEEEDDENDEKQWQMNILEGVLGKPMHKPDFKKPQTLPKMIRYNPMDSSHAQYEIKDKETVLEKPVKKKRNKSEVVEVKEEVIPRSAEVFYEVPKNLTQCFESEKEFSLLKTLGRETIQTVEKPADQEEKTSKGDASNFQFNRRNPFKYDSSDDEVEEEQNNHIDLKQDKFDSKVEIPKKRSKFFLQLNDPRFQEAIDFFKKDNKNDEETFKQRRTEIKQILRKKIRNNLKKSVPSRRKKIRKMAKGFSTK